MPHCQLHHIAFTLPSQLTADELPQIVSDLFNIDGLDPAAVRLPGGRHGYREAYSLSSNGVELISILSNGAARNTKGTCHVVVHGAALDAGGFDPAHLCREIIRRRGWGTRIDLAADDVDGVLPWEEIMECCQPDQYQNRLTTTTCRPSRNPETGKIEDTPPVYMRQQGETLYLGNADSDVSICLYTRRGPVRVEGRIRNRAAATDLIRRIADGEDITVLTLGVLSRNLKFHVPGYRRKDRRPTTAWWENFISAVAPLKLPRQRAQGHRSPWYVPPTRAIKVTKAVQRSLAGATETDIQAIIAALSDLLPLPAAAFAA